MSAGGGWSRRLLLPALAVALVGLGVALYVKRDRLLLAWHVRRLGDPARRAEALKELAKRAPEELVPVLVPRLALDDPQAAWGAAFALESSLPAEQVDPGVLGERGHRMVLLLAQAKLEADVEQRSFLGVEHADLPGTGLLVLSLERPELVLGTEAGAGLEMLPWLKTAPDPRIRWAVARAVGCSSLPPEVLNPALLEAARSDPDPVVRVTALRARLGFLRRERSEAPSEPLLAECQGLFEGDDIATAAAAARALVEAGALPEASWPRALEVWGASLPPSRVPDDRVGGAQEDALLGLAQLRSPEASASLADALRVGGEYEDFAPWALVEAARRAGPLLEGRWAGQDGIDLLVVGWLARALSQPEGAFDYVEGPGGGDALEVLADQLQLRREVQAALAQSPGRAALARAAGALLGRVAKREGLRGSWRRELLADHLLRVLLVCGGPEAAAASESFAASSPQGELRAVGGRAQRLSALLRGELPRELSVGRERLRGWLGRHVGPDGRAGGDRVHPVGHPCAAQGRGIPYLEHRTPLACLALLPADGAQGLLGPTVRWLADPARDGQLGLGRAEADSGISDGLLPEAAAVGDVPRALEELLVVYALQRAGAEGVAPAEAAAALDRRRRQLAGVAIAEEERACMLLVASVLGEGAPRIRGRALALRERVRRRQPRSPWAFASRRWLGEFPPSPLDRVAADEGLPVVPEQGDAWLTTLALEGADPFFRRVWLFEVVERLARDLAQPWKGVPGLPVECADAVVLVGQEDPLVATAWYSLAIDAVEEALQR